MRYDRAMGTGRVEEALPRRQWIGRWTLIVGALHTLVGFAVFAAPLGALAQRGFNGLGDRDPLRNLAFWFVFAGIYLVLAGHLADRLERAGTLPRSFGWTLLVTTIVGVVLAPASGFWLAFPPAIASAFARP